MEPTAKNSPRQKRCERTLVKENRKPDDPDIHEINFFSFFISMFVEQMEVFGTPLKNRI